MPARMTSLALATLAVVASVVGCGEPEPKFDPATRYSPASLARELAFRYKSLDRSKPAAARPDGEPAKKDAPTKGAAATKAARPDTLEALLDDVASKAATIPDMSPAEARKKVAEQVSTDATFSDADKKIIAERLSRAGD